MSYRRDLRLLRRARRLAKRQQRELTELELTGLTAVTLNAHGRQLTVILNCPTGAPFTDELRELLRERRQALRAEARQVRQAWLEEQRLHPPPAEARANGS